MQGGGGSCSTGKSRALDTNVILNSERSERDSGSDQCWKLPVTLVRFRIKFGMTLKDILSLRAAFTMAEILLSLTIIGVVVVITLPSLTGNINERTWNTQRKALYARFSQAIALMPALNGFGTLDDTTDTAAETFVTGGLAKVLKINNICDSEHLADCGIVSSYIDIHGTKKVMPKTLTEMNSFESFLPSVRNYSWNFSILYGQ